VTLGPAATATYTLHLRLPARPKILPIEVVPSPRVRPTTVVFDLDLDGRRWKAQGSLVRPLVLTT
jgi:hypothetical protein